MGYALVREKLELYRNAYYAALNPWSWACDSSLQCVAVLDWEDSGMLRSVLQCGVLYSNQPVIMRSPISCFCVFNFFSCNCKRMGSGWTYKIGGGMCVWERMESRLFWFEEQTRTLKSSTKCKRKGTDLFGACQRPCGWVPSEKYIAVVFLLCKTTLPNYIFDSQKHGPIPFLLLCSRLLTSHSPSATSTPLPSTTTLGTHSTNSTLTPSQSLSLTWSPCHIKVANVPTATYYALLLKPFGKWTFSTKPICTYPTLIVEMLPTFTLPVTTSSAVIFSNLHNTFAPTLTNYPYSAFEPKPPPTSHPTSTLPMTTHTPPTTSAIAPLASPSRSWVMNSTSSYTVPTRPPSSTLPSSALPALFVDMTSAPGPHTPHSNKLLFSLGPAPLNSSASTTKHGLTLLPLHAHNSSTHSNLNTNPQPLPGPYRHSINQHTYYSCTTAWWLSTLQCN